MKKILFSIIALLGVLGANADTTWDFTSVSDADYAALGNDAVNWAKDASVDRYGNATNLENAALMANGTELDFAKGILFTVSKKDGIRIDRKNKRLGLNGSEIVVTIPNLKQGQTIKVISRIGNSAGTDRYLEATTNLNVVSGFATHNADEQITNEATVVSDGAISFTTKVGGINLFSITITSTGGGGGETPSGSSDVINNAVPINTNVNQAVFTLNSGDVKYYNTESVASININDATNQINVVSSTGSEDIYYGSVQKMSFRKKVETGAEGQYENTDGKVKILEVQGWQESAYVKWELFSGATSYMVYIKGGQYTDWTKLDDPLVRNYGTYGRADAVGLMAASNYELKVVPVLGDAAEGSEAKHGKDHQHQRSRSRDQPLRRSSGYHRRL